MTEMILHWPLWQMIRYLGLASYLFLFIGISFGIIYSMPFLKGKRKTWIYAVHRYSNGVGFVIGVTHAMILIIDTYIPFTWREILIPFAAKNAPVWNGLGTLAIYGTILIFIATDLRNRLGKKLWHIVHLLAYPIFLIALFHGIGVGSDTQFTWVRMMYLSTGATVVLLTLIRI